MGFTVTEETKGKIARHLLAVVVAAYDVRNYKMDAREWGELAEHDKVGFMEFVDQIVAELETQPGVATVAVPQAVTEALGDGDHRNPLACEICGKVAKSKRGLNMHVKGMHAEEPVPA